MTKWRDCVLIGHEWHKPFFGHLKFHYWSPPIRYCCCEFLVNVHTKGLFLMSTTTTLPILMAENKALLVRDIRLPACILQILHLYSRSCPWVQDLAFTTKTVCSSMGWYQLWNSEIFKAAFVFEMYIDLFVRLFYHTDCDYSCQDLSFSSVIYYPALRINW